MFCTSPNISNYTCCSFGRTGPTGPTGPAGILAVVNNGGGSEIGQNVTGTDLNLRTLLGGGSTTVTESVNNITISSPTLTLTSLPGGQSLIGSTFPGATLRSLIGGPGISLVSTANNITVNNTQTPVTTVTNLGTLPGSVGVLVDILAGSVRAKSLLANGNIQVTDDGAHIYIRPLITNVIPYSGKTILNTYLSGNPELSDFLSFSTNIPITSIDAFPADYVTLPTAFCGWVSPYRCQLKRVSTLIKFSIPTNITEQLDIYCSVHRCKEGDISMNIIWSDLVFSTTSNISVGDFVQRTFDMAVDIDVGWHLYFSFFAHRPDAAGSTDLVEFYTSSSATFVSPDSF